MYLKNENKNFNRISYSSQSALLNFSLLCILGEKYNRPFEHFLDIVFKLFLLFQVRVVISVDTDTFSGFVVI